MTRFALQSPTWQTITTAPVVQLTYTNVDRYSTSTRKAARGLEATSEEVSSVIKAQRLKGGQLYHFQRKDPNCLSRMLSQLKRVISRVAKSDTDIQSAHGPWSQRMCAQR